MKIAIPVDENKEAVCVSFGRAPYFLIYDDKTETSEIKPNPAANAEGGAGLKAAQFVVDAGATVLITVRCGQNAADVFKAAETKIFKAQDGDAQKNLLAMLEGKLSELTSFHSGFHGRA